MELSVCNCLTSTLSFSQEPNVRIRHEPALDLAGGECQPAADYTKRPHVFRLKLAVGAEYLFMAKDQVRYHFIGFLWGI